MKDLLKDLTTLKYYKSKPKSDSAEPTAQPTPVEPVKQAVTSAPKTPTKPLPPQQWQGIAPTLDQQQGGLIDVDGEEETIDRLTGPGAKFAKRSNKPKMTAEVLGRELRR